MTAPAGGAGVDFELHSMLLVHRYARQQTELERIGPTCSSCKHGVRSLVVQACQITAESPNISRCADSSALMAP